MAAASVWAASGPAGTARAAAPPAAGTGTPDGQLGTVVKKQGATCLSMHRAGLRAGTTVAVIVPDAPQAILQGRITGRRAACAEEGASGYALRLTRGSLPNGRVAAGILAPPSTVGMAGPAATASLPGSQAALRFRSCTGADGVNVTAWDGEPLTGRRVWHRYVYLGQDLEPNCSAQDNP